MTKVRVYLALALNVALSVHTAAPDVLCSRVLGGRRGGTPLLRSDVPLFSDDLWYT
jgi:hypothetical protein